MTGVRLTLLLASLLGWQGATAQQQVASWPIFTTGITDPAVSAVNFIVNRAEATPARPLMFSEQKLDPQGFCKVLLESATGLYVSTLSTYRRCRPNEPALGGFDFPFLADDWAGARRVLNGPIGAAIVEALGRSGTQVLTFWQGDTRVFTSSRTIASAFDLKGRKILSSPTFASSTVIAQNGGQSIRRAFAETASALGTGQADTADVSLSFATLALTQVQKSVLVSNHSFDPLIVSAPSKSIGSLTSPQLRFLEGLASQSTIHQVREARAVQARNLAALRERGLSVAELSPENRATFKTAVLRDASATNARVVFGRASPAIAATVLSQAQGQPISPYWKVSFVTNRAIADGKPLPSGGPALQFGQADIELDFDEPTIFPVDALSSLIRYAVKGSGVVIDWSKVSTTPFPKGFAKAARSAPAKAPIIYIHGFANSFDDALRRAAWIGWNAKRPVVAFAWPSRGSPLPDDYRIDQQTADASRQLLAALLDRLGREYETSTDVDIVVHSMGARLLLGTLEALPGPAAGQGPAIKFRQLLMVAPDVATNHLHEKWAGLAGYFEWKATLYVSDHDLALGISRQFMNPTDGPRAGLAPPVPVEDGIESIFIGTNDFSFLGHSYHVANGIIADDIVEALRWGVGADDRRGSGPSPSGKGYFELRRLKGL